MQFNHLHVHTEYSTLDGLAKIEELILKAKQDNQTAIAITDHGTSSGLYEAQQLGIKHSFKVLLGEEFYFSNDDGKNGHIILIAKNNKGLENIYKLQELAYENVYYKPRINMNMLREYGNGLICTTACIANQVGQYILRNELLLALTHISELASIFKEDFYLELQSSTVNEVIKVNKQLLKWINEYNYKYIITNDVHYVDKDDYGVHEVLLCIQQKSKMSSEKRWKFEKNDYWLKTDQEVYEYMKSYLTVSDYDKAKCFINEIIGKCNATIESGDYLPKYNSEFYSDVGEVSEHNEDEQLADLTYESIYTKLMQRGEYNEEFKTDIDKELGVIKETGYSGYFMIVQEYINWAKANGILVGDGRGSGAGSKVAYTIGITEINPQKYNLLFERFLSIGREPDFDVDFSDIDAVFKHLQDRYGKNNVARVGAFNRFTCKSALRKVMSCFDFSQREITKIVNLLPKELHFTLEDAMEYSKEFSKWLEKNKHIYKCVFKLENIMSHMSTHAGGVVICKDLTKKLPVFTQSDNREKLIIGYDKHIIEALGHYKFDILGLKSLSLLKDALDNIEEEIDWHNVDFNDEKVYDYLCNGNVLGVFQLSEQHDNVVEQQPKNFEDLIAINALIRPGVGDWNEYIRRRKEEDSGRYDRDSIKHEYMRSTSGIIVYQEQYLLLANTYAGWGIAYSDKHIRKNKNIQSDKELQIKFVTDSLERGYDIEEVTNIWEDIKAVVSGGYGFNRSHSASYAKLSFQTSYLACYYPKAFYAAYLSQMADNKLEIIKVKSLLDKFGIKLLPPDINESGAKYKPTKEGILVALSSINNVGGSVLYAIEQMKPIKDLKDFLDRRIPKFVKSTSIENLIKAGAFDFTGKTRDELLDEYKPSIEHTSIALYEKDSLGLYISESPYDNLNLKEFTEYNNGEQVVTVGEISDLTVRYDKRGNEMAFAKASNNTDNINLVVFSSTWNKIKNIINEDDLFLIKGKKDKESILLDTVEVVAL